jgi:hypothetical protein
VRDLSLIKDSFENYRNRTTVADYVMSQLYNQDKAFAIRVDLINGLKRNDEIYLNLFKDRHGIKTDRDLDKWRFSAQEYILHIRRDIFVRLMTGIKSEFIKIMNDEDFLNDFITKYKVKEEDLKNDIFFQCSKYVYRRIDNKG